MGQTALLRGNRNALELKDQKTTRHSRGVSLFTIAIAWAMGVPREQIKVIARGAFLHDIGKMAIPDNILNKPGKLDPDEFETMEWHPHHGYQIVKQIPFLAEASEIVYSHQEWYDGGGYPRQLRGVEIPLGARIVAIANALYSITSDRPYRPAQPLKADREEIQRFLVNVFVVKQVVIAQPARDEGYGLYQSQSN